MMKPRFLCGECAAFRYSSRIMTHARLDIIDGWIRCPLKGGVGEREGILPANLIFLLAIAFATTTAPVRVSSNLIAKHDRNGLQDEKDGACKGCRHLLLDRCPCWLAKGGLVAIHGDDKDSRRLHHRGYSSSRGMEVPDPSEMEPAPHHGQWVLLTQFLDQGTIAADSPIRPRSV